MYKTLSEEYPDIKDGLTERYTQFNDSLAELRDKVSETLGKAKRRTFAVWHPSLSYFAREFALEQLPLGVEGKDLSAKALAEAIDHAKADSVADENGSVTEVLATYDPESKGGNPADGRKVKGATIHWVDAATCADAEVRQYDNLFLDPDPDAAGKDFLACMNPNSLEVLTGCKVEAALKDAKAPASYQFMRLGYFCPDSKDCAPGHLVFNRSVSLKDSFKPGK